VLTGTYFSGTRGASLASCLSCPGGKFSTVQGSVSGSNCGDCATGSYSDGTGTGCTTCPEGSYSNTARASDASVCVTCGVGFYGPAGATLCSSCPAFSTSTIGSISSTGCRCIAGYTGADGATCSVCPAGKYKSFAGAADCSSCGPFSSSPTGSTVVNSCTCNPGYTGPDGGEASCADQRLVRVKAYKGQYTYKITFEASGRESTTGGPGGLPLAFSSATLPL